jgi:chromosome segregation ATPase
MVVIEHPRHEDRKLIAPEKPADQTRSFYRFEVAVKAGELAILEVSEDSMYRQTLGLISGDLDTVLYYSKHEITKPAVREVLKKVLELRGKITEAQKGIDVELAALKEIADDQERIRKNIERAPKESDTFKRYLKKFDDQETEIEKRQARIKELKAELGKLEKAFRDYAESVGAE